MEKNSQHRVKNGSQMFADGSDETDFLSQMFADEVMTQIFKAVSQMLADGADDTDILAHLASASSNQSENICDPFFIECAQHLCHPINQPTSVILFYQAIGICIISLITQHL